MVHSIICMPGQAGRGFFNFNEMNELGAAQVGAIRKDQNIHAGSFVS